ncbi:golgin subfamily A member 6-like protein 7 [Vidua macroura]|uniref:golgin subfamily A member 6-like protein 7 n=1 Tax=Vidua macroura TaxID=187451 RepID=UPI0023A7C632|nr:golgin subfamily A member 6-like protein 7 [Vidua macroura]XP_053860058.1 golgin subfamily A member 6-like protein 7 [Vidua macroura]
MVTSEGHVKHVFSGADAKILPEKEQEQIALSEMPCRTQGELRAREQEEQLRQQVEEPQENGQNIKAEPQAELPEAQSAITEVKKRNQEETRRIQEEMNLHQQRGDQQNQVSERVAATPLMKDPLSCILQNLKEQLDTDFQKAHAKIKAREKRQEEEIKIIREKLNPLPQALQKQVQVLTSHRAAGKDFRQMSGTEEPRGGREAQELSPPKVLQVGHDLKMVQEKRTQWGEDEHLNKELHVCLKPLEGERNP